MSNEQFTNNGQTTLVNSITAGQSTITVNSVLGFPTAPQFRIMIDQEIMLVFSIAGSVWGVNRAVEPVAGIQAAAAHNAGATVSQVLTAVGLRSAGIQNNVAATSVPSTAQDVTKGYSPGSLWYNTVSGKLWICTSNASGAAVWLPTPLLTGFSLTIDSNGSISLVNDANVTGVANKYYGTNAGGTRGFFTLPGGGGGVTIGGAVSGASNGMMLFVDGSGNLAELGAVSSVNANGVSVQFGTGAVGLGYVNLIDVGNNSAFSCHDPAGANYVILAAQGAEAGNFTDSGANQVIICSGTYALAVTGNVGFFGVTPVGQHSSSGAVSAGASYTGTEQNMLNDCYDCLRQLGLLA